MKESIVWGCSNKTKSLGDSYMENQAVNQTVDTPTEQVVDTPTEEVVEKTFSQAEVDKMLQAETDRRVNQAKAKWEKELASKMEEEKRLSKLSAEERQREIAKQEAEKFQAERAEFEQQRAEFHRQKMQLDLVKELEAEGLPVSFSSFLLGTDIDTTFANLQAFKAEYQTALQKAVEQHVEEALRGGKSPMGKVEGKGVMSKKEFFNLPAKQRTKMLNENPDLVQAILNGN